MNSKIKEMSPSYRPDEKFLKYGAGALTAAELLAIIIRTGNNESNAIEFAKKLLCMGGTDENILNILKYDYNDLIKIKGVGKVKALQIKAVAELSKRISYAKNIPGKAFTGPESIAMSYMEVMRHKKKEVVLLLLLNGRCELIKEIFISEGTVNYSVLSGREVFIEAVKYEAVNIILLHNHPCGKMVPSAADIETTKRISEAGAMIGIELLDHIIIGDREYISLKENGYL